MPNRFIVAVMAATLALTSLSAIPAQALDRGERNRLILGAGALLLLGHALTNNNRNGKVTRRYVEPPRYVEPRHVEPRYVEPRRFNVVPSSCMRINRTDHGPRRYFSRHCLRKNMRNFSALPGHCQRNIWTRNGNRTVFGAPCLRNSGWVFG